MGKKIGKYEFGRTIGKGAFSTVKIATDQETGMSFAVKIIDKQQVADQGLQEQQRRELAILRQVKHPHVVELREVFHLPMHMCIVLELVSGGELFERILTAKFLEEPTARRYFQQLIQGIQYCHSLNIAHRDLKPENLLLDANDNIKITDFGLANFQVGNTALKTDCGTLHYTSPEVLRGMGYNGFATDVWSCGVVLFAMLAGYLPFDDDNVNVLSIKIERGSYTVPRHFSDSAKDLIGKMLTVDPAKRITIEGIMCHPWFMIDYRPAIVAGTVQTDGLTLAIKALANAAANPSPTESALTPPGEIERVDAFDIIARLTKGALNPLVASQVIEKRACSSFLLEGGMHDLVASLRTMNATISNPHTAVAVAVMQTSKGTVTVEFKCMQTVCSSTLVEARRIQGDTFQFHDSFRHLIRTLGPKVRSRICTAVSSPPKPR